MKPPSFSGNAKAITNKIKKANKQSKKDTFCSAKDENKGSGLLYYKYLITHIIF